MKLGFGLAVVGFFLLWCAAWLAGTFFFRFGRNGSLKRKWYAPYVIAMAVAFCLLFIVPLPDWTPGEEHKPAPAAEEESSMDTGEILVALIFIPLVAFKAWRNIRTVRFCEKCGTMNREKVFTRAKRCRSCGAELPGRFSVDI